jgi:hypothetical protein
MTPTPRTHIVPSDDPLKNLAQPQPGSCTPQTTTVNITSDTTWNREPTAAQWERGFSPWPRRSH